MPGVMWCLVQSLTPHREWKKGPVPVQLPHGVQRREGAEGPGDPGLPGLISPLCPGPHGPCASQRAVALTAGSPAPWPGLAAWGPSPAPSPAGSVRAAFPSEAQPQHPGGVTSSLSSGKGVHRGVTRHA